jgi:hypothetical protein
MFQSIDAERRRDLRHLEDFYYECIYGIVRTADTNPSAIAALHQFKAKLIRLHTRRLRRSVMDTSAADNIAGESPTLYQLIRKHQRRETRTIRSIRDKNGEIQTSPAGIATAFVDFFQAKYRNVEVDIGSVNVTADMVRAEPPTPCPPMTHYSPHKKYIRHLTQEGKTEPQVATTSASNTTERLGTSWAMISATFSTLCFFMGPPRHNKNWAQLSASPIKLLNTDYMLLTRILARRLRPLRDWHLKDTQYCGVTGNTIFDAVTTIRDVAAYAENAHRPLYILTLDFQNSFDSIAHEYLFTILHSYGLSNQFVTLLRNLYADTTLCVQINGHLYGPIPIRRGVRQGCPLSMALFTMCLQPFITLLRHRLPGISIGRSS